MPNTMESTRNEIVPTEEAGKLTRFKEDIILDAELTEDQRDHANIDMRFINVTGGMWEGFEDNQFQDRTKLEMDLVSNHVHRFVGNWNLNRVGVNFKPYDAMNSMTTDSDADLINSMYRADYLDGNGKAATDNGVREGTTCGIGHFKLATKFEDEGDKENNLQRIEWRQVTGSYNTVFWDNAAKLMMKQDARRCTVLTQFTPDSFEREYPGADPVSAYHPDTRQFFNYQADRVHLIYIATRYEIIKKKEFVYQYNNRITNKIDTYSEKDHELIKDELKVDPNRKFMMKRKITTQIVEKSIFSGSEFLKKPKKIAGKFIPIIPMYAHWSYVDGTEWYHGLVRKLLDAQRLYNMQVSQLAENSATAGQEVPIFDPSQIPVSIQDGWENKNNKPYLLAFALRDKDGNIVHHGPLAYSQPPRLDGSTEQLLQIVPAYFNEQTGGAPQEIMDPKASGKAIRALQKREDLNTQVINDNYAMAVQRSGEVYQSMAADVYSVKRMVRTVGLDGTDGTKALLKTVMDEKTGRLVESNNLRGKKFLVYSDIGPQYDTLREETTEDLKGLIPILIESGAQDMVPTAIAALIENSTGSGMEALKKKNRRNMILAGDVKPENDEEKKFLQEAQQNQSNPQDDLIKAATEQAASEAQKFQSEARNLDSKSLDNAASAQKKAAETRKIISETENAKVKTLLDIEKQNRELARELPFQVGRRTVTPLAS